MVLVFVWEHSKVKPIAVWSKTLRRGHRLKSHLIDLKTLGPNSGPLGTKRFVYILHYAEMDETKASQLIVL